MYAYKGEHFLNWLKKKDTLNFPFRWVILSAKYGFIEPNHPISNYDVTFDDKSTGPISIETLKNQANYQVRWSDNKKLSDFDEIWFIGPDSYYQIVCEIFKGKNIKQEI